jgi:hypothetical protein
MLNLTYNEMLSAYDDYPAPIRPYLLRAETHPLLREKLTKSFMRAFIDLLSRANIANPARPIWVRMDTTARRLGISAKTVSRTIALMTENAWLRPNERHDGRNWQGKYAGREFILSTELRKIVGLPIDVTPPPSPGDPGAARDGSTGASCHIPAAEPAGSGSSAQLESFDGVEKSEGAKEASETAVGKSTSERTGMSDGSASFPQNPAEDRGDQTEMSDGYIGVNNVFLKKGASLKSEAFIIETQGEKTIRIPADLADMHIVFGISGKGICGLMRFAKEKCQRLQDVWKAKKDQLAKAGATGGRAVLYLRRLLSCGEDFAYIARNMISSPAAPTEPVPAGNAPVQRSPAYGERLDARKPSSGVDLIDHLNLLEFGKTCAFRKFRHVSNDMTVRFYDGSADVSRGSTYEVYAGEMLIGLYRGVYRGNLVEVKE